MPTRAWPLCILLLGLSLTAGCTGKSSDQHIAKARQYIAESQFASATIELKNALLKDRNSAEARWLLGQNYLATGEVESAAKELEHARKLGWSPDDVLPALARALLAQGAYVRVRDLPPGDLNPAARSELLSIQALAEFAQGNTELANELIGRALALAPGAANVQLAEARILLGQGDLTGALAAAHNVLAVTPTSGQAWSVSGDIYLRRGEVDEALAAYGKSLEYQPHNLVDRLKTALLKLQTRNYQGALSDARVLLQRAPDNPGANYVKGLVLFQNREYAEALIPLSLAEPAWQKFPLVLFFLGSAHLVQGNLEQAATYASRFHDSFADHIAGRKLLATIRLQQRKFAAVEELVSPVLDRDPDDVDALTLLANALLFNNRVDEGIAALARVAELQPASAAARIRLGTGLMLSGDSGAASEQIATALELDPQFQQAGILLVLSHLQSRDYDAAIEAANAYRKRYPDSAIAHNLLGRAYLAKDESDAARLSFETALTLNPGDPSANHALAKMALAQDDAAAARRYYTAVLEQDAAHLSTLIQLALLDAKDGNEQAVVANMERAMAAHPEAIEPRLLLGRYYLAIGKPERLPPLFTTLDNSRRRSPRVLLLLALSQISGADSAGAQYTLDEMLRSTPETPETHHLLAMAAAGTGDNAKARESLAAALALNPNFLPSRLALARMDLRAGDLDSFHRHLDALVALAPASADVLQLRAAAAEIDGDPAAALAFSRKAYALAPATYTMLELAHYLKLAGETTEAINVMREWVAAHPLDLPARLALAAELHMAGLAGPAIAQYRSVLEADPDNLVALTNLSWELRRSDPQQSLALAERAIEIAPDAAQVLDTLAMAAYVNRDYLRAARNIRRALVIAPENPGYRYHKALILTAQGDTGGATAMLEQLLREESTFAERSEAAQLLGELRTRG